MVYTFFIINTTRKGRSKTDVLKVKVAERVRFTRHLMNFICPLIYKNEIRGGDLELKKGTNASSKENRVFKQYLEF